MGGAIRSIFCRHKGFRFLAAFAMLLEAVILRARVQEMTGRVQDGRIRVAGSEPMLKCRLRTAFLQLPAQNIRKR